MNSYKLNHFNKVANDMNNYLAVSAYYYYQNQYYQSMRDRRNDFTVYQKPSLMNGGLSGLLAYGLYTIGMPSNVVNFGYRFGYFLDANA